MSLFPPRYPRQGPSHGACPQVRALTRSAEPHGLGVRAEGTGFNNPGMGSFPKRIKYLISIEILTLVLKFEGLHYLDRYYLTILIK